MLLYHHNCFKAHNTGSHPEQIQRIENVNQMLLAQGWTERCHCPAWEPASVAQLATIHGSDYIQQLQQWCENDAGRVEADTVVSRGTWEAASMGAGAAIDAVQRITQGEEHNGEQHKRAFCAIRPPGHHALPSAPMGFCVLNHIAIAARAALAQGLSRILIVDWDVHHGNGTQDAFYEDGQVGFFSIHRSPFYPGTGSASETGSGAGLGWTHNQPVSGTILLSQFMDAFERGLEKMAETVRPELILLSAGFDAHRNDPVGSLCLESQDFATLTNKLVDVAEKWCQGRIISLLEGGYHLEHLPESVNQHLAALQPSQAAPTQENC